MALGNAPYEAQIIPLLESRLGMSDVLDEHIVWAVKQQLEKRGENAIEIQTSQQKRLIRAVEKVYQETHDPLINVKFSALNFVTLPCV